MDSSSINLFGSEVESIRVEGARVSLRFSRAYIEKAMTGSRERTRWWQSGTLIFDGAEVLEALPEAPAVCDGGDVSENVYTYRDMLPLPMMGKGPAHCNLRFRDTERRLVVRAEEVSLTMDDREHYIEHIRA
ncbi:MAG: hypothetical protein AB2814_03765 [Candidatus Sedimenticola endophacoides]